MYRVDDQAITVHLPKSIDESGQQVHEYRVKWKSRSVEGNYLLPPWKDPFIWTGFATGHKPGLSGQDYLIFPKEVKAKSTDTYVMFRVPHPDSVFAFRWAMSPNRVFKTRFMETLSPSVTNPARLGFPIVFSYTNASSTAVLKFMNIDSQEVSILPYDGGAPVNVHIHADPPGCAHGNHIFINNQALLVDGKPLELEYEDLSAMRCTPIHPQDPTLALIGLSPSDLEENCEVARRTKPSDHDARTADGPSLLTLPPDACFGMWVFE